MIGDEIIQLNDRSCPNDFKGGLPEIEYYLETTLQIQFTIIRNTDEQPPKAPKYVDPRKKKKGPQVNIVVGSLMQLQGILSKPELNSKVVEVLGKNDGSRTGSNKKGSADQQQQLLLTDDDFLDIMDEICPPSPQPHHYFYHHYIPPASPQWQTLLPGRCV